MLNFCGRKIKGFKNRLRNLDRSRPRLVLGAALIISVFSCLLFNSQLTRTLAEYNYDLMLRLEDRVSPRTDSPEDSPVVIIAIDDHTLSYDQLSIPELFRHHYYLEIIKALHKAGAKGVALVSMLPRSGDAFSSSVDVREWFETLNRINPEMPVLSGVLWRPNYLVLPAPDYLMFMPPENFGFLNLKRDDDSSVRRQPVTWPSCYGKLGCRSLTWLAARTVNPELEEPGDEFFIDFDARPNAVPVFSFLETYRRSQLGDDDFFRRFEGRLVLIGQINFLNKGTYPTPFSQKNGQGDTAVEVTAQAVLTLIEGRQFNAVGAMAEFFLVLIWLLIALLPLTLSQRCGPYPGIWLPLILAPAYLGLSAAAFVHHIYLPVISGVCALVMAQIFCLSVRSDETRLVTRTSMTALSLYINPTLADQIVKHPELLTRGGQRQEMTVFFSDLVGFTALAEHISPESLVVSLNRYFETMEPIIRAHGGILDKFDGDAIMAFWGSPLLPRPAHAADGCLAALDQRDTLARLNEQLVAEGRPPFSVLMGLNTGQAVVGNIGAENRLNYTVMGDSVNLASRLVPVNKIYQTQIIVSETTAAEAAAAVELRSLDRITVPGRSESLAIFEVMSRKGELSDRQGRGREIYEAALRLYFKREFQKALGLFEETFSYLGGDGPAELMSARCREFMRVPPLDDWQGVSSLATK